MNCESSVEEKNDKLEKLINQLKRSYEGGCTGSGSEIEKLEKLIEKLDSKDEKLIILFHHIFFGKLEILQKYKEYFLSTLKNEPEDIKNIIKEIYSNRKYGNHRKFCTKSFDYYKNALTSFKKILPKIKKNLEDDESFDTLYNQLTKVDSFGRTAAWDFLEVIDRIISDHPLNPNKMYLRGATGPKYGVHYFFNVNDNNELREKLKGELEDKSLRYNYEYLEEAGMRIFNIIKNSNISDEIRNDYFLIYNLEDALCIFQKDK